MQVSVTGSIWQKKKNKKHKWSTKKQNGRCSRRDSDVHDLQEKEKEKKENEMK